MARYLSEDEKLINQKEKDSTVGIVLAMNRLAAIESKLASPWQSFKRGVMYGFGFFIGSALLAALTVYLMTRLEGLSYLGNFIQAINKNIN